MGSRGTGGVVLNSRPFSIVEKFSPVFRFVERTCPLVLQSKGDERVRSFSDLFCSFHSPNFSSPGSQTPDRWPGILSKPQGNDSKTTGWLDVVVVARNGSGLALVTLLLLFYCQNLLAVPMVQAWLQLLRVCPQSPSPSRLLFIATRNYPRANAQPSSCSFESSYSNQATDWTKQTPWNTHTTLQGILSVLSFLRWNAVFLINRLIWVARRKVEKNRKKYGYFNDRDILSNVNIKLSQWEIVNFAYLKSYVNTLSVTLWLCQCLLFLLDISSESKLRALVKHWILNTHSALNGF